MWNYVIYCFVFYAHLSKINALWDDEVVCPLVCTCQLEHLRETAIHRFVKKYEENEQLTETDFYLNNEVLYEDDFEDMSDSNPVLRAATCILQTDTEPLHLIQSLPKNIEALTLIQGSESGNKSLNLTHLQQLPHLLIIELHGSKAIDEKNENVFFCEIDTPLPEIKYLNFEKISIKISKQLMTKPETEPAEVVKFKEPSARNPSSPHLSMTQRGANKEILPYNKYVQQEDDKNNPLMVGFDNLRLLRISNCELKNIDWEMFDGLQNLQYLILERNNLKIIPDFAFYGLPHLKSLSLAGNNLLNMQITNLAGLLELEYLDLSHNNFSLLSELTFPPFPNLKLANFGHNPINIIFPSTFEVMNTTASLILGGENTQLTLVPNSFLGLRMLKKLTLTNLVLPILKRELLFGMPNLTELMMSGNIPKIEFDTFVDLLRLRKLVITQCSVQNISMDAFNELARLHILDLSQNKLEYLHPGTFDPLNGLKELYLHKNKLTNLPENIFSQIHPRLIRLNENPWHCSCRMSEWKPMVINKIKQKIVRHCDFSDDKGVGCDYDTVFHVKYVFDSRVTPICASPKKFVNWNVFHVMRKKLRCANYKPKYRKKVTAVNDSVFTENYTSSEEQTEENKLTTMASINEANDLHMTKLEKLKEKIKKHTEIKDMHDNNINSAHPQDMPIKISLFPSFMKNDEENDLNYMHTNLLPPLNLKVHPDEYFRRNKTGHQRVGKKQKKISAPQNKQTPLLM